MTSKINVKDCERNIYKWLEDKPHLSEFFSNFLLSYTGEGSLYLVGGLIRDLALDKSSNKDVDFMIDLANESDMTLLLKGMKKKRQIHFFQKVGKSFPVFKIKIDGEEEALDFALARIERSTGKGHDNFWVDADNISAESDGKRRDFTVNALFARLYLDEENLCIDFVDYFNGLDDLNSMTLRAVGDAKLRLEEDPLRILRAIRFCHQKGFCLSGDLEKIISDHSRSLLPELSHDRIQEELLKTMTANFYNGLKDYLKYDFFGICFKELSWFPTKDFDYFDSIKKVDADLVYPLLLVPYLSQLDFDSNQISIKQIEQDLNEIHCRRQKKIKECITGLMQLVHKDKTGYPLAIEEQVLNKDQGKNTLFLYQHFKSYFSWNDLELDRDKLHPTRLSGNDICKWGIRPQKGFEKLVLTLRQLQLEGESKLEVLKSVALEYKL
ncbi:MAG: CCA tRNA nucleotidyltransferase [Candidatus Cloacimonetes bacterium]|nr:CCA tRNA nucleotidyltransferase [Candidatus Cloacimonadota bacterium]